MVKHEKNHNLNVVEDMQSLIENYLTGTCFYSNQKKIVMLVFISPEFSKHKAFHLLEVESGEILESDTQFKYFPLTLIDPGTKIVFLF